MRKETPSQLPALTGPRRGRLQGGDSEEGDAPPASSWHSPGRGGRHRGGRFTGLHVHQQVGVTAHPEENAAARLCGLGQPPDTPGTGPTASPGADAFFIWRRGKNKLRQGECAEAAGEAGLDGRGQRRAMDCHRRGGSKAPDCGSADNSGTHGKEAPGL